METNLHAHLTSGAEPPEPSVKTLESIVSRARRSTWHMLAVVAALMLATGLTAGALVTSLTRTAAPPAKAQGGSRNLTSELTAALVSQGSAAPGAAPSTRSGPVFTRLFLRTTTGGIAIRAYSVTPPPNFTCPVNRLIVAEVSDTDAVDAGPAPVPNGPAASPVELLGASVFGTGSADRAVWISMRTQPDVTRVTLSVPDGATDEMAPVQGFAVLAVPLPVPPLTIQAFGANGTVIETDTLPGHDHLPQLNCHETPPTGATAHRGHAPGNPPNGVGNPPIGGIVPPSAKQPPPAGTPFAALGILTAASSTSITFTAAQPPWLAGRSVTATVPAGTVVQLEGNDVAPGTLQAGEQVMAVLVQEPGGYVAEHVGARNAGA